MLSEPCDDRVAAGIVADLRAGGPARWLRSTISGREALSPEVTATDIEDAKARFVRFEPALRRLFAGSDWDGRIRSDLFEMPDTSGSPAVLVKGDHALPLTGSIKARGGVYELLCRIEAIARQSGLLDDGDYGALAGPQARDILSRHKVVVASTGNLGFSIGLVARGFGMAAEIHMSHDAKAWKKERLRRLGATVVEHRCDYSETVARARASALSEGAYFVDDEDSRALLVGYATAAEEVAGQLLARGIVPTWEAPLVVYLPCGVGGAPGGITLGLKTIFGDAVICVFVEPVASACVLAALISPGRPLPDVYALGLDNDTLADGLAVPRASALVMDVVGDAIDAVVALPDQAMVDWVRRAWQGAALRLEPSAAASLAAVAPMLAVARGYAKWPDLSHATHLAWATGGSLLPDDEFAALLGASA